MDRRKFIGTCASCAFASMGAILLSRRNILNKYNLAINSDKTQNYIMHHVEVHLAEHCNLGCKYCGHFSSVAEKEFYNLNQFKKDVKRLSYILKQNLPVFLLMGGEPLLNPQISKYIKITKKYFPNTDIYIDTNATLLDDMDEKFWETLKENDATIMPSVYPIEINWASIMDKVKKYDVKLYGNPFSIGTNKNREPIQPITLDNIEKFRVRYFYKLVLDENGNDGAYNLKCAARFRCNNLFNGKLYPCPNTAYVRHLNKKFGTNFVVTENDYVDIYKIRNADEINKFLHTKHFPFCRYCRESIPYVKWETAANHDISEWT